MYPPDRKTSDPNAFVWKNEWVCVYIKQKDIPPHLGGGRSFSLVPGSSPVPAGSRSDLLYNEQIAKQFASLTDDSIKFL